MQVHPELTTALLAENERDLRTRAEQRRLLPKRDLPPRSAGPLGRRPRPLRSLIVLICAPGENVASYADELPELGVARAAPPDQGAAHGRQPG